MSRQNFIVIQGLPGTGKSTLAAKLTEDLGIAMLGKDMLKEFLFDQLKVKDLTESRLMGVVAIQSLYIFADEYLRATKSVIIENAFMVSYARDHVRRLIQDHDPNYIEIFCYTDSDLWSKRILERVTTGERHPGHFDSVELISQLNLDEYVPLNVTEPIKINTSAFNENDYQVLLSNLKTRLL